MIYWWSFIIIFTMYLPFSRNGYVVGTICIVTTCNKLNALAEGSDRAITFCVSYIQGFLVVVSNWIMFQIPHIYESILLWKFSKYKIV